MPIHARPTSDLTAALGHLQARDRSLLDLLADHRVLTTPQVTAVLFDSTRACQQRLTALCRLGFLDRFRGRPARGGSYPWHWTLGPLGLRAHAAALGQTPPSPRYLRDRLDQLAFHPQLAHLLGVNQFFVDLLAHGRRHPDTRLVRWWAERRSANEFVGIHPDGHGLWQAKGTTVGFFLEYDTGTENLARLTAKIDAYTRLAHTGGPTYPVLFWLHSPVREANLRKLLDRRADYPVATAARGADTLGPGGPVWALDDANSRLHLQELPSAHGIDVPRNPNWRHGVLTLDA